MRKDHNGKECRRGLIAEQRALQAIASPIAQKVKDLIESRPWTPSVHELETLIEGELRKALQTQGLTLFERLIRLML